MRYRPTWLTCCLIAVLGLPACQDPQWKTAKEQRKERIHGVASRYVAYDAAGRERAAKTMDEFRSLGQYHIEHFHRTARLVEREWESDVRRWNEERIKRRDFVREQYRGRPETIPATWRKMVY